MFVVHVVQVLLYSVALLIAEQADAKAIQGGGLGDRLFGDVLFDRKLCGVLIVVRDQTRRVAHHLVTERFENRFFTRLRML